MLESTSSEFDHPDLSDHLSDLSGSASALFYFSSCSPSHQPTTYHQNDRGVPVVGPTSVPTLPRWG